MAKQPKKPPSDRDTIGIRFDGGAEISEVHTYFVPAARRGGGAEITGTIAPLEMRGSQKQKQKKRRARYSSYLTNWLVNQKLGYLVKIGAKDAAKEFWDDCHKERPDLASSLPARSRTIIPAIKKNILERMERVEKAKRKGQ